MIITKVDQVFDATMLPGLEFAREVDSIIQGGLAGYAAVNHQYVSVDIEVEPWKQGRHTPDVVIDVFVNCMGVKLQIGQYLVESVVRTTVDSIVTEILESLERKIAEFVKSVTDSINFWHQEVIRRRDLKDSRQQDQ